MEGEGSQVQVQPLLQGVQGQPGLTETSCHWKQKQPLFILLDTMTILKRETRRHATALEGSSGNRYWQLPRPLMHVYIINLSMHNMSMHTLTTSPRIPSIAYPQIFWISFSGFPNTLISHLVVRWSPPPSRCPDLPTGSSESLRLSATGDTPTAEGRCQSKLIRTL